MYKIQIQQKTLWNIKFLFYNNHNSAIEGVNSVVANL